MQITKNFSIMVSALWKKKIFHDAEYFRPTHMISLLDPICTDCSELTNIAEKHMMIKITDQTEANADVMPRSTLGSLIDFLDMAILTSQGKDVRLLLHCHLGASRSPAVAYIALSRLFGYGEEEKAFDMLLRLTNKPWPNHGIVAKTDEILNHNGALLSPLDNYRKKWPRRHQAYRRLNRLLKRVPLVKNGS
jgi:predicted protein tyrosine phosphatase